MFKPFYQPIQLQPREIKISQLLSSARPGQTTYLHLATPRAQRDPSSRHSLHIASPHQASTYKRCSSAVRAFISAGAKINTICLSWLTPFHETAERTSRDIWALGGARAGRKRQGRPWGGYASCHGDCEEYLQERYYRAYRWGYCIVAFIIYVAITVFVELREAGRGTPRIVE